MLKKALPILLFCMLLPNFSKGQGTTGKDFWVAFMAQDWHCSNAFFFKHRDTHQVFLSSQFAAKVTIMVDSQHFKKTVTLQPNVMTVVTLPEDDLMWLYTDTVLSNGVHITADTPINVHAVNRNSGSEGATVVIPTASIPESPEYVVTTYRDPGFYGWFCGKKRIQTAEFVILGIADSSVIEIVPTGASMKSPANVPYQITLKKGQTFQSIASDLDLTGSIIRTKYIHSKYAVFAGNREAGTFRGQCATGWDHTYEQMVPTVCWGQNYTALPFRNNTEGYTLKIVAAENNTKIFLDGTNVAILDQGENYTYEVWKDTLVRIKGSNKISVAQFAMGGCKNHPTKAWFGDVAQVMLFPDEQFGTAATISTVELDWSALNTPEHYINVMTRSADTAQFRLDNTKPANNVWKTTVNIPGYHYARLLVDSGCHGMYSSKGFLAYVYGYYVGEGYAYAAAANFRPIQNNFLITNAQCVKDTTLFQAITNDSFSNYKWTFGDKSSMAYGPKVKHKYKDTGWYTVVMYCYHKRTNAMDSVVKVVYIADTKIKSLFGSDTLICGKLNFVEKSKGFDYDNKYKWNDGWPLYYKLIKTPGLYWLEVKEENGCVFRDTMIVSNGAIPHSNFTVSDDTFCLNRSRTVKFTNKSTSQDSVKNYVWDFGPAIYTTTNKDTLFSYNFPKANAYPVILRVNTRKGCYHDTFMIVNVLPSPKASFSFTKKDTCYNTNQIEVKNNTVIDSAYHKRFKWYFTDGYVQSNGNPGTHHYASTGNYGIMLIYEYNNGCIDTMTRSVKIVPNPVAGYTYNNSIFCPDVAILLANTSTSTFKPLNYQWNFGDSTTSSDSFPKKAWKNAGTYSVKVVVTAPTGCKDTATKAILVSPVPLVDFMINKDTQCLRGHSFTFTNKTKFASPLVYTWKLGDGNTSKDSNILNKTYVRDSVYTVELFATTNLGCSAKTTRKVYLGGHPKAQFQIDKSQQCYRSNHFNFTNSSTIAQGSIASYQWDMGDASQFITANVNNKQYLREDTFNVRMVVTSDKGCTDTLKKLAITFAQPKTKFAVNSDVQCFKQQNFALTNQTTLKYGLLTWQWNFGDGKTSADTNYNKKYAKDSTYVIRLISTSDHNCRDTVYKTVVLNVSPDAVYQLDKDKQCFKGNVFNFVNKSNIKKGSITSYEWQMGDNNSYTSSDVLKYSYTTEDTFKVKLIAKTDKNCNDTATKLAIAFAQPLVKFTIPKDTQCWQKNYFVIINNTKLKYGTLDNTWDFGDGTFSKTFQPTNKRYPNKSQDYIIKYKAISEHGCSDSAQHHIVLLERPISDFGINDSIQCFRTHQFIFTNKTTFSAMNTMRYWWSYANGDTSMGFWPKTVKFNRPGLYSMRLISYSYLTNCYDTIYKTLIPAPHAAPDFALNADSQCLRFNKFVVSNTSQVMFGSMSWKWGFGDGTQDTTANPVKSYIAEGIYRIKLVATTNYGCADSTDVGIGFYATPKAAFGINDPAQCLNKHSFDFTNNSSISRGTFAPEWWYDDMNGSSSANVSNKQFITAGDHLIRLSLLSDKGCKDTAIQTVYLENDHNSSIDFLENDSQCLKGNIFNFTNTNHNSKVSFTSSKWVYGDGQESTLAIPQSQSFNKDGQFKVMLVTVSATGCADTTYAEIMIHPHPVANYTAGKVCFPEPVKFTNASSIKTGLIAKYNWQFGDSDISTEPNPLHYYQTYGQYDVILRSVSEYGCADTLKITKAANVQQKPRADFSFEILSTIVVDQSRLQFSNHSKYASNYSWSFGNSTGSMEENPLAIFTDTGRYHVTLIAFSSEGCSDTITKPTGEIIPDFFFYLPSAFSPDGNSHNDIYKGMGGNFVFSFRMEIFNRWGEKLFETNDLHQGWDGTYQGSPCQQDTYLCRVQIIPLKGYVKVYQQMFTLLR